MTIGQRIKKRRKELKMSQEELAHKLGYTSRSAIHKIESDARNLKQDKIKPLAIALDTSVEYIMGWDKPQIELQRLSEANQKKMIDYYHLLLSSQKND